MPLTGTIFRIPRYLGIDNQAKIAEGLIQHFLVNFRIKISNEQIGANILCAFILWCFINFDGFSK